MNRQATIDAEFRQTMETVMTEIILLLKEYQHHRDLIRAHEETVEQRQLIIGNGNVEMSRSTQIMIADINSMRNEVGRYENILQDLQNHAAALLGQ